MKWVYVPTFFLLLSPAFALGTAFGQPQSSASGSAKQAAGKRSSTTSKEEQIAQGRYLVVEVARCPDCHTPRDSEGKLDVSRWLRGGPMWIMPTQSKQTWALQTPALARFPYSDQQGQDILERGIGTNGNPIQPPMHAYHLRHEDAVAIIAYLRSL
jgi:mono/diheme cytochrome c family protein